LVIRGSDGGFVSIFSQAPASPCCLTDGKTSRRSHNRKTDQKALHPVSAFATCDAKADYLLAVKDNQPTLHEDIRSYPRRPRRSKSSKRSAGPRPVRGPPPHGLSCSSAGTTPRAAIQAPLAGPSPTFMRDLPSSSPTCQKSADNINWQSNPHKKRRPQSVPTTVWGSQATEKGQPSLGRCSGESCDGRGQLLALNRREYLGRHACGRLFLISGMPVRNTALCWWPV
jgi:hypothetical protein